MQKLLNQAAFAVSLIVAGTLFADVGYADDGDHDYDHGPEAQEFIHGIPEHATDIWLLSAGGRMYDNWWAALDKDEPEGTNPAYPASGQKSGATTWRCKECHGWDYQGAAGVYQKGSHYTGIPGIRGAVGRPVSLLVETLRDENHPYTPEMISDEEMERVAAFVSRGQVDMSDFMNFETRTLTRGDVDRGRQIFQTTCAACHGFDGRAMDWGDGDESKFVGTEAAEVPDEVFSKIMNAHPGVAMINLRAFGLEDAVNVLAYAATLPVGPAEE